MAKQFCSPPREVKILKRNHTIASGTNQFTMSKIDEYYLASICYAGTWQGGWSATRGFFYDGSGTYAVFVYENVPSDNTSQYIEIWIKE